MRKFILPALAATLSLIPIACSSVERGFGDLRREFSSIIEEMPKHYTYEHKPIRPNLADIFNRAILPKRDSPYFEREWHYADKSLKGVVKDAARESVENQVDLSIYAPQETFTNSEGQVTSFTDYLSPHASFSSVDLSLRAPTYYIPIIGGLFSTIFPSQKIELIGKTEYNFENSIDYRIGLSITEPNKKNELSIYVEEEREKNEKNPNGTVTWIMIAMPLIPK
jgi:hypothetical protein